MKQQVILCIDDEIIVLESLKEQLQKEFGTDYIIEIAETGTEAIEIYQELAEEGMEFPVFLADFIMPDIKGDELLEKLHTESPLSKKVMLTGQASIEGVSNAVNRANLYRYITKPWDKSDMILTIKEAIKSYELEIAIREKNKELSTLNENLEKKVEERTHQLEELNKTKDKFFSIIAHDLKNPFNTLLGFTELIKENFDKYDNEQLKYYISILYDTADHGYSLLLNLLEWSRSQTGSIRMEQEVLEINKIVDDALRLLENSAEKKQIKINTSISNSETVFADFNMLQTVIRNLISNAIKYTNTGGEISIKSVRKNKFLIVSVKDNGIGIKPEIIDKLFRLDQNISTKGTNDETGTGLGLLLCKEFIEKNGGKIWVESIPESGSEFFFSLRINKTSK
jgi:signal transduction histidine kinase